MKLSLLKALVLSCMIIFLTSIANAQGNNGRGKCMEPFGISFYTVKGGYEDEWLELYMKWHYPLMQYALENGTMLEHKLFVPDGHSLGEQWTFAVSFLFPSSQDRKNAPQEPAELIEEIFGELIDD